ncbi:MAG: hypothetical protein MJE63_02480 [Proteobacteria bacterium]|nr:hypothetical protein [Pseudomonadota bacterium]
MKSSLFAFTIFLSLFCFLTVSTPVAADQKTEDTTDLSQMDWSDDPEEEDLSQESWADEEGESESSGELSDMSWEDEEGEYEDTEAVKTGQGMSQEEELALDIRERRIHVTGFLLFVGYIIGAVLTGYFTRNRKLAVDYPPELLILLHTVWPIEWVFMLFAGKKVR